MCKTLLFIFFKQVGNFVITHNHTVQYFELIMNTLSISVEN